jgi:hypothetical protein
VHTSVFRRRSSGRNSSVTARFRPIGVVLADKNNWKKLAVGSGSARLTKATIPFLQRRLRGRRKMADKKRTHPDCSCPVWHGGQAGRWHGPRPTDEKYVGRGRAFPESLRGMDARTVQGDSASGRTLNTPHRASGSRTAHEPRPASAGKLPPSDGPESHAPFCGVRWPDRPRACGWGFPRLQAREDVNDQLPLTSNFGHQSNH